jgi:hypothetical protein
VRTRGVDSDAKERLVTLVQVLVDETSLYMACDFCLTDADTGQVLRNDAFKLVTVTSPSVLALIGVTGVGTLENKPVGTWIADVMSDIIGRKSVEDVLDALAHEGRNLYRASSCATAGTLSLSAR